MKTEGLSISDLKSALDFIIEHITEIKEKATKDSINVNNITAYTEAKELESNLYNELLNRCMTLN